MISDWLNKDAYFYLCETLDLKKVNVKKLPGYSYITRHMTYRKTKFMGMDVSTLSKGWSIMPKNLLSQYTNYMYLYAFGIESKHHTGT